MRKTCPKCGSLKDAAKHFGLCFRKNNDGEFSGDGYQRYCKTCRWAASKLAKQRLRKRQSMAHMSEAAFYKKPPEEMVEKYEVPVQEESAVIVIASTGPHFPASHDQLKELYRKSCKDTANRSRALMISRLTKRWEKGLRWDGDYELLSQSTQEEAEQ